MVNVLIFIFGLIFGSFLNVCIYRMPRDQSIVWPGSACTACKKPIAWYDNIPLLSYAILRGKCRHCSAAISMQYPLVELLGGIACVAAWNQGMDYPYAIMANVILLSLIVITFIDIEHQIIPDEITLSGIVIGLVFSTIYPGWHGVSGHGQGVLYSLLGILTGGGFLLLTAVIAEKLLKKEAMGGGDIKLLGAVGALFGWKGALMTLFAGSMVGSFVAVFLKIFFKQDRIPFGPYLAVGVIITLLWGEKIISWYMARMLQY